MILQNSWTLGKEGQESASILEAIRYFIAEAGSDPHGNPLPQTPMKGGIAIFAAGNDNSSGNWYPACYDEVIAVASVNHNGKRATYSNYGAWVDIAAPGGETSPAIAGGIYSTLPDNKYGYLQGTSMACPHVSGIAALALSRYGSPSYTPDQLRNRLLAGVEPLPDDPDAVPLGTGLIKAPKVIADYQAVDGVALPPTIEVLHRRTVKPTPSIQPTNATDQRVAWTVSNTAIAAIRTNNVIEGKALGTTSITVTTLDGAFTATADLHVVPLRVESITVSPAQASIIKGHEQQLTAEIHPADATTTDLSWHSTDPTIATVSTTGKVVAHEIGSTAIIATSADGGYSDTSYVSVEQPVAGVQIEPEHIRILRGDAITITAQVYPTDAYDRNIAWSSSDAEIVAITAAGRALAKRHGNATITATTNDGAHQASAHVTVYESIHAPQGFSPDGDGINDHFVITMDTRRVYALTVFDRSGQIYYQTTDYRNDWDGVANTGRRKGSKVPAGTYYYSLTTSDGAARKGFFVIRY